MIRQRLRREDDVKIRRYAIMENLHSFFQITDQEKLKAVTREVFVYKIKWFSE